MTFSEVKKGQEFEFDHSGLECGCLGFAHGPWRKETHFNYVKADGTDNHWHKVGTLKCGVRLKEGCGGKFRGEVSK